MTDLARLVPHAGLAVALAAMLGALTPPAAAREMALEAARTRPAQWTVSDVMIPMRDGVKLHTKIFVPNIFAAKDSDFRPATQRIYRSAAFPSHVTIPVAPPAR